MSRRVASVAAFARYYPLDELLEMPRVRVLRAMRHFDWASAEDLRVALDIPADRRAWNTLAKQLQRLTVEGALERTGPHATLFQYRITELGKRQLRGLLARGIVNDREARA